MEDKIAEATHHSSQWASGAGNYEAQRQLDFRVTAQNTLKVTPNNDVSAASAKTVEQRKKNRG
jgi:hypothetical protein